MVRAAILSCIVLFLAIMTNRRIWAELVQADLKILERRKVSTTRRSSSTMARRMLMLLFV
jgi:hypothetical protein